MIRYHHHDAVAEIVFDTPGDPDDLAPAGAALVAQLTDYSAGALRLVKGFADGIASAGVEDRGLFAVDRLVEWLEAGRP
jgi:hypothetical protein